jgi:hypothetical protein
MDVFLVQETIDEGKEILESIRKILRDWNFLPLDALNNSRGILMS